MPTSPGFTATHGGGTGIQRGSEPGVGRAGARPAMEAHRIVPCLTRQGHQGPERHFSKITLHNRSQRSGRLFFRQYAQPANSGRSASRQINNHHRGGAPSSGEVPVNGITDQSLPREGALAADPSGHREERPGQSVVHDELSVGFLWAQVSRLRSCGDFVGDSLAQDVVAGCVTDGRVLAAAHAWWPDAVAGAGL
jgi:hypothetical protein